MKLSNCYLLKFSKYRLPSCVISVFHREVDENCALLGSYTARVAAIPNRRFGTTSRPVE